MKKTIKQRNLEILLANGWTEDPNARSSKYLTLTKPGVDYRYFLGRSGAVRQGRTVSGSLSVRLKGNELIKKPNRFLSDPTGCPASSPKLTLEQVAQQAIKITQQAYEAPSMGYDDGGALGRTVDAAIKKLAEENGFTFEQVETEMSNIAHADEAREDCLDNYE